MGMLEIAKYSFMGIFLLYFALDIFSEKSYRIQSYASLTMAIIFLVLGQSWSTAIKIGFLVLVGILTIKTITDEKKRLGKKQ